MDLTNHSEQVDISSPVRRGVGSHLIPTVPLRNAHVVTVASKSRLTATHDQEVCDESKNTGAHGCRFGSRMRRDGFGRRRIRRWDCQRVSLSAATPTRAGSVPAVPAMRGPAPAAGTDDGPRARVRHGRSVPAWPRPLTVGRRDEGHVDQVCVPTSVNPVAVPECGRRPRLLRRGGAGEHRRRRGWLVASLRQPSRCRT